MDILTHLFVLCRPPFSGYFDASLCVQQGFSLRQHLHEVQDSKPLGMFNPFPSVNILTLDVFLEFFSGSYSNVKQSVKTAQASGVPEFP